MVVLVGNQWMRTIFLAVKYALSLSLTQRTGRHRHFISPRYCYSVLHSLPCFFQPKHHAAWQDGFLTALFLWLGIVMNFYFGSYLSTFVAKVQSEKRYWEIVVLITAMNHQTCDALMAVFMSAFSSACNEQGHTENSGEFNLPPLISVPPCSQRRQWKCQQPQK